MEPPEGYWARRAEIAARAAGIEADPLDIDYTDTEHGVWAAVAATLTPLWEQHAAAEVLAAKDRLGLPADHLPQLSEVSARLEPLTGFRYVAVDGLVPVDQFFGLLARSRFASTQYVRWEGAPLYTPEPDVIHEVMGHANCLACPEIAELHRLAGAAIERLDAGPVRQFVSDVFWFSVEFGVVRSPEGWRAYGTGLLSSPGELAWFADHAEIRPLDVQAMGSTPYDIDHYQPVLFGADSFAHVLDIVGAFFSSVRDSNPHTIGGR